MKHARIAWAGAIHEAVESDGELLLTRSPWAGKRLKFDEVVWLPPLAPVAQARTILALGLNYADHAKELAFKAPEEPLVFVKGEASLIGHKALTRRPQGVTHMHYECELAVVMGRTAKHVKKENALDYVGGYTVANDYAIRDYLENWYRPNLRVKNRDTCTPIGPWLVDAADIPNPMSLKLQTTVKPLEMGRRVVVAVDSGVELSKVVEGRPLKFVREFAPGIGIWEAADPVAAAAVDRAPFQ